MFWADGHWSQWDESDVPQLNQRFISSSPPAAPSVSLTSNMTPVMMVEGHMVSGCPV